MRPEGWIYIVAMLAILMGLVAQPTEAEPIEAPVMIGMFPIQSSPAPECPAPPLPTVCGVGPNGIEITQEIPQRIPPIAATRTLRTRITCGQRQIGERLVPCVRMEERGEWKEYQNFGHSEIRDLATGWREGDAGRCLPVPEPALWKLMGIGLIGLAVMGRR